MKKLFIAFQLVFFMSLTANAQDLDVSGWYQYNGASSAHSFSVKFPQDWQAKTEGDSSQNFVPENVDEIKIFTIEEFEGQTYSQAINYYVNENTTLQKTEDFVFTNGDDLIAKKAFYKDKTEDKEFSKTFIRRGSLIVSLTDPNLEGVSNFPIQDEYNDIVSAIRDSFNFTDNWHQYIDFKNQYTFIFSSTLKSGNLSDGVSISDPTHLDSEIFTVLKYADTSIENVAEEAEGYKEDLSTTSDISFHGISKAISAEYYDNENKKSFSRIFVENGEACYALTNVNIEKNFPHLDYYDNYVLEMLESFEFFDIEGNYFGYKYFPDVREDHVNEKSIDYLAEKKVVAGYPDGEFKPDGAINRAELTKMIVATKETPDPLKYKDCFPDVHEEWFAPFICYAKEKGWVTGYSDGKFRPEKSINRVEALKIVIEVLFPQITQNESLKSNSVIDINVDDWYGKYFVFADNRNLLDKQHIVMEADKYYYLPNDNITRKEVAEIIYRSIK